MDLSKYYATQIASGDVKDAPTVWLVVEDINHTPQGVHECQLQRVGEIGSSVTLHFGCRDFGTNCHHWALARHLNHDWHATKKEALDAAWYRITSLMIEKTDELEQLERIQKLLLKS
jgi:hypothetical protein